MILRKDLVDKWQPPKHGETLKMARQQSQKANYLKLYGGCSPMAMNMMDQEEIVKSVVDSFRVRCNHKHIEVTAEELQRVYDVLGEILEGYQDNSGMIGGQWDNG
jgi:hypothetical protein